LFLLYVFPFGFLLSINPSSSSLEPRQEEVWAER